MKVVISGTTGVGKSTTVSLLKETLELLGKKVFIVGEMVVGSPYFDLYFSNLAEWGFLAQLDFLMERYKQFIEIESKMLEDEKSIFIFDRHFLEDKIFSELYWVQQNTSAFQANVYKSIFDTLISKTLNFNKINYFILLKADFDVVQERMKKRGRSQEEKFNIKYWKDLYWRYYNFSAYKKLFIDNSQNFLELSTNEKTPTEVVDSIVKYITKRTNF